MVGHRLLVVLAVRAPIREMAVNTGVPWSCPRCRAEGSPTGGLVFEGGEIPTCKYHPGTPFERSIFYDEAGNRLTPTREVAYPSPDPRWDLTSPKETDDSGN